MCNVELVEGKGRPAKLNNLKYDDCGGKTCGLLLWMLCNYFLTGRYVVLDLGFCVIKAIVELKKEGLFAGELINKRGYWPALVPGDAISKYFKTKSVGEMILAVVS